jgi:hypothetical protein
MRRQAAAIDKHDTPRMHAPDYRDDLLRFQRNNEIGDEATIDVGDPQPDYGSRVTVTVRTVEAAMLTDDHGHAWPVRGVLRLDLVADRATCYTLRAADGRLLAEAQFEPYVETPEIAAWNLPDPVDYAARELIIQPTLRNCVSAHADWRAEGEPDWQPLGEVPARLLLQPGPGRLELRVRMRSRHAGVHPAGSSEHLAVVQVLHPAPRWQLQGGLAPLRHAPATLQLHANWVRAARLRAFGRVLHVGGAPTGETAATPVLAVPTDHVGEHEVEVEIDALDGTRVHERHRLHVVPRPASCRVELRPDGVAYELVNALPERLELPGLRRSLPLAHARAVVRPSYAGAIAARLVYRDDAGELHQQALPLARAGTPWTALPQLPALPRLESPAH